MAHQLDKQLLANDAMMFDVSGLRAGTYILALDTGIEVLTAQFVVVR